MSPRAAIAGVVRYAMNYWGNPLRAKTAACDACGHQQHEYGSAAQVTAVFRAEGWLVASDAEGTPCLCAGCALAMWQAFSWSGLGLKFLEASYGVEEGESCRRFGCEGIIEFSNPDHTEGCSCFQRAPCSHCMNTRHNCPICGWAEEAP